MAIKNGQSRETGNIGHKRHRNEDKQTKKKHKTHITKTLTNTINRNRTSYICEQRNNCYATLLATELECFPTFSLIIPENCFLE